MPLTSGWSRDDSTSCPSVKPGIPGVHERERIHEAGVVRE